MQYATESDQHRKFLKVVQSKQMSLNNLILRNSRKIMAISTIFAITLVCYNQRRIEKTSASTESTSATKSTTVITPNTIDGHLVPGKFNLIEEAVRYNSALLRPSKKCSIENMNKERLQQDHPCVLNNLQSHFLKPPAQLNEPYRLDYPEVRDPAFGIPDKVLELLHNKRDGFFIECGALDGENLSNTLYMERYLNWTGILIEADQDVFETLLSKKRKSWALPVCLSDDPYPQEVTFRASYALGQVHSENLPARNLSGQTGSSGREIKVQCFPLYSVVLAIGRTEIDYFSLDIEQHELFVLKTIPFHKLNIKVLSVEIFRTSEQQMAIFHEMVNYMKEQGYDYLPPAKEDIDVIFVKSELFDVSTLKLYKNDVDNK